MSSVMKQNSTLLTFPIINLVSMVVRKGVIALLFGTATSQTIFEITNMCNTCILYHGNTEGGYCFTLW